MSTQGSPMFMVSTTYGLGNGSCQVCPWTDGGSDPATYFWAEKSKVSNLVVAGNYFTDYMTDFGLTVMVFNFYPCMTPDPGIIGEDGIPLDMTPYGVKPIMPDIDSDRIATLVGNPTTYTYTYTDVNAQTGQIYETYTRQGVYTGGGDFGRGSSGDYTNAKDCSGGPYPVVYIEAGLTSQLSGYSHHFYQGNTIYIYLINGTSEPRYAEYGGFTNGLAYWVTTWRGSLLGVCGGFETYEEHMYYDQLLCAFGGGGGIVDVTERLEVSM